MPVRWDEEGNLLLEDKLIIEVRLGDKTSIRLRHPDFTESPYLTGWVSLNDIEHLRSANYCAVVRDWIKTGFGDDWRSILEEVIGAFQEKLALYAPEGETVLAEEPSLSDEEKADATTFLKDPQLLFHIHNSRGEIQGEDKNKVYLFLAILGKESVEVQGESAGGKNMLVDGILGLFPDVWWQKITGASDKALRYLRKELRTLYIAERRGLSSRGEESTAEYDAKLVISEGKLSILVPFRDPETGEITSQTLETTIENIILTSTEVDLPEELENRIHILKIDDSPEQNRMVRDYYLDDATKLPSERNDYNPMATQIQNIVSLMEEEAPRTTIVDYAPLLSSLLKTSKARVRRDVQKLIKLIKTSARLHYKQRYIIDDGGTHVVVAEPEDFWIIWRIGKEALTHTFGGLSEELETTLKFCHRCAGDGNIITSPNLATYTGKSSSTAYKHLKKLAEKGHLIYKGKGEKNVNLYDLVATQFTPFSFDLDPSVKPSDLREYTEKRVNQSVLHASPQGRGMESGG